VRGARAEEWLRLDGSRFMWLTELPPGTAGNPTFSTAHTPQRSTAVNQRVRSRPLALPTPLRGTSAWGTCPCPADHTFTPASTPSVANRREGAYPAPSWGPHAPAAAAACAWQGSSRACTAVERLAGL